MISSTHLIVVILDVKGPCQLIATLGAHVLVFRAVEGVERQVLDFGVILLEEEVVGEVVEDHRVRRVDLVRFGQLLNGGTDGVRSLEVHLQDGETHQRPDTTDTREMIAVSAQR